MSPEALAEGASRKAAEERWKQVLRDAANLLTSIALPFPAMVDSPDQIDSVLADHAAAYCEALARLDGLVQYELTATWAEEEQMDLAKPVSGAEFARRRERTEVRVSAIDNKLRTVTAGVVRDWRMKQERRSRIWTALLARGDRERFLAALRSAGPSEGVRLRLSGPWPPTDFAGLP